MHWDQYFTKDTLGSAYCIIGDIEQYRDTLLVHLSTTFPEYTQESFSFETMKVEDAAMIRQTHTEHAQTLLILTIHFATRETQNALLKFIEEPPAGTHIILCVPHHTTLLDTLYSRCVCIDLRGESSFSKNSTELHEGLPHPKIFLALSYQERLELIKKLTKKAGKASPHDDQDEEDDEEKDLEGEDESPNEDIDTDEEGVGASLTKKKLTHTDVQKFITELERYLYVNKKILKSHAPYIHILETLETMKGYLASPSSSIGMILDMIALTLPVVSH